MKIIYIISLVTMLAIFMLIKKNDKKQNFLGILGLGLGLLLSYNVIECYVINYFDIKLNFLNLSIVNIVIDLFGIFYMIRKKEIQQYIFDVKDFIYVFLLRYFIFDIDFISIWLSC